MKKRAIVSAVATLLCASVLGSCTGISNKIAFKDYWNEDSISMQSIDETLVLKGLNIIYNKNRK